MYECANVVGENAGAHTEGKHPGGGYGPAAGFIKFKMRRKFLDMHKSD